MTLAAPIWLLLAIPLAASMFVWKPPSRLLTVLRATAAALVLLAMCGAGLRLPSRRGTVVVVADRSLSMPSDSVTAQKESVGMIASGMGGDDRLAVVSFARTAAVEQPPQQGGFGGFLADVGRDASNLADALDLAQSLIPPGQPGRILVLSDGRATGRDVAPALARIASSGVAVDYRPMQRPAAGDVAVAAVDAPPSVTPGESFMIAAWIDSPVRQDISYEVLGGGRVIARGSQAAPPGRSRLLFRDQASQAGAVSYTVRVAGAGADPMPENNSARLMVGVQGPRPMLCVSPTARSALAALLSAGKMNVRHVTPEECKWTLEKLSDYSAVLIENTPAGRIGAAGMETLAAWVSQTGRGMMMTGGRDAYGPGGYFRSPLEPIMPVSMELRREHRKLSLAIVVALDRSGSMAMTVPGGRAKMDLANLATAQVLDMLSGMDQFGCIAVDSSPHVIASLAGVTDKDSIRGKILRIDSMGGGIFIYEALQAAASMVSSATAGTRHIILFADAADSEQPGDYKTLVEKCRKAGITISVIGLGTEGDCDAGLLKDIARRGGGRCFFTDSAHDLPRLFAQDTLVVARSSFLDQKTAIQSTAGMISLASRQYQPMPTLGGYNLCYLREGANLAVATVDEYKAPVVAAWQAGVGRVLCYTGEADGKYTGEIAGWPSAGEFFTSLARWTAGSAQELPEGMLVTQDLSGGLCRVTLHLDPERKANPFSRAPQVTTLLGEEGRKPEVRKTSLRWETADTMAAEIPLHGSQTALTSVEVDGSARCTLSPVCLPYSPEFAPEHGDEGVRTLDRLARATGGQQRANLAGIWKDLPQMPRLLPLAPWLLLTAAGLFLLEVLQRRTGLLSLGWAAAALRRLRQRVRKARPVPRAGAAPAAAQPREKGQAKPEAGEEQAAPPPAEAREDRESISDALARARKAARGRTNR